VKNYVILLAGGVGKRMQSSLPKQFIEVDGKPIIVYTLERFQINSRIEKIVIVCIKDYIEHTKTLIKDYSFSKVEWIIEGGDTSHDSIRNGVFFLKDKINSDDFIIVHDAVRPILPQKAIDEVLKVAYDKGNAASSVECHPPIVYTEDHESGITDIDREHIMLTASPQAFRYSLALECYKQAEDKNRHDFTFTSSLLINCGKRVYFAKGTSCNIKVTNKEDIALVQALLKLDEKLLFN